ncbi:hypothetical protein D3C72_1574940 [compost metagenome]
MIDDNRQVQPRQRRQVAQIGVAGRPELRVQAVRLHARRQRRNLVESHAAGKQVAGGVARLDKAQAAHAAFVQITQLRVGDRRIGHGDSAQAVCALRQRVQQRIRVGAIGRRLHQHAARRAQRVQHAQVARRRGVRRGVGRRMLQRKAVVGTEDVAMRVARARGQHLCRRDRHARRLDAVRHVGAGFLVPAGGGAHDCPPLPSGASRLSAGPPSSCGVSSGGGASSGIGISCAFSVMETMV